ncbi:putative transposase, Ptta/En/Spm, plant [Rosa chinensis]|uniref:Putative transposase, Ptta/En/Spm, plant n=1 Tax=Rosa chinensis TaxID=74649 RepID=A0A2P6QR48_ROSCH|nr:putative transposase, Ptta/En/Spm, plant [Rosa chinensis]
MVTINKRNRSQKRMNQSTGTRTYASLAHEYVKLLHGKEPDRWELFKLTHRKAGTQEPIDAASAKAIADFEEAEQKRLSMNVDITAPEIREEMYAEVLGKEKGNRVRGLGAGVTWDEVPGIHVEERGVSKEVQLLRERLEAQTKEAQEREARLMDELQRKMVEQTKKMEEMFEVRCVGMAVQKMGELFKQCGISVDTQEDMEQTMSQFAQNISQRPSNVIFSPNNDVYRPTLPFECSDMQTD